ncbi:MAG: helix-turn-helix transcriptional regulator [Parvularculaceae bacterium]
MQRQFQGVSIRRVIDHSGTSVPEHAHDWPLLSLYVLGGYRNRTELGAVEITGPSAVLYRSGAAHLNSVGSAGFEQIEIEFDPSSVGSELLPDAPVTHWLDGEMAKAARMFAFTCMKDTTEDDLLHSVRAYLEAGRKAKRASRPVWLAHAIERIRSDPAIRVQSIARELCLHPSAFGTAFQRATGEGVLEFAARLRVQFAARLLRETDRSFVDVSLSAGFCDQSHMNRSMKRVLGRTPLAIRREREAFRRAS